MTDPSSSSPKPLSRLDRSGLERVLARAAELQSGAGDTDESFTDEQLLDLGKEVGLSPQSLRQALAEERTRSTSPEEERGFVATLFGPARVGASRVVGGRAEDVLAAIDTWMQRQELLIVKRHHSDRMVWEPRRDFLVGLKRAFKVGGRDYALSRAFEVSATVFAVDDKQVHVGLDADFRNYRLMSSRVAVGTSLAGGIATASLFAMSVTAIVAAAPVVLPPIFAIGVARAIHGRDVARAQLALEQLLDRLERGEYARRGPESLLGAIVAAASTVLPPRRY